MTSSGPVQLPAVPPGNDRLDSWKEIAAYMNRDVRTVQRWEKQSSLPVRRHAQDKVGNVYAFKSELDAWWRASSGVVQIEDVTISIPVSGMAPEPAEAEYREDLLETFDLQREDGPPSPLNWFSAHWRIAVVALLCVAAVAGVAYRASQQKASETLAAKPRLLVLPLENLGGDPSFAPGLTEELITRLGLISPDHLAVLARSTSVRYAGQKIADLHRELNVDYVLEGSVLREEQRIRLTVRLIRTKDETPVWTNTFERKLQDIISLQDELANEVANEIDVKIVPAVRASKVNAAAYEDYLKGRYFWNKRGAEAVLKSRQYFELSVREDPNYAPAYAGLADTVALLSSSQLGVIAPLDGFPMAEKAALESIRLDPRLAAPHASLGYVYLVFERDKESSRREFDAALALDPNYATAYQWYGLYFEALGDNQRAIEKVRKAHDLEPVSLAVNIALTEAYYFARDFIRAVDQGKRTVELDPGSALAHFNLGRAYELQGRQSEAITEFETARTIAPAPATMAPLAYAYGRAGRAAEARAILDQLPIIAKQYYVAPLYYLAIYAGLGDVNACLPWLEKGVSDKSDYLVFLPVDPMADGLMRDARTRSIVEAHRLQ